MSSDVNSDVDTALRAARSQLAASAKTVVSAGAAHLGAANAALAAAESEKGAVAGKSDADFQRALALAGNHAAQQAAEHRSLALDAVVKLGGSLDPTNTKTLDAHRYLELGSVAVPAGANHAGMNTETAVPAIVPFLNGGNLLIRSDGVSNVSTTIAHKAVLDGLAGTGPGQLTIVSIDPKIRGTVSGFSALSRAKTELMRDDASSEDQIEDVLRTLAQDVRRVSALFRGRPIDLGNFRDETQQPIDGYQLVVYTDYPTGLSQRGQSLLLTLLESGPRCGVSFILLHDTRAETAHGVSATSADEHATVVDLQSRPARLSIAPALEYSPPDAIALGDIDSVASVVAQRSDAAAAPSISFSGLHPEESFWTESSADGIAATIGRAGHEPVEIRLGDEREQRHNCLVSGAVGQGKSNLLMAIVHSIAWRYSPDEVEMYLLDLKEGLTLEPLAPALPDRPDFLPHARVLALETDTAYASAVLGDLVGEFNRRAKIIKRSGDNIARYRAANPEERMPRILVVVDEFQKLFGDDESAAAAAVSALESLSREGRAYGIHMILASQTLSGITALLAKQDGIFAQFPTRLALKNSTSESRVVLDQQNTEAARLRFRGEIIVNEDFGSPDGNRRAVVADASPSVTAGSRQRILKSLVNPAPPIVFRGDRPASLADHVEHLRGLRAAAASASEQAALVGLAISTLPTPVGMGLSASAGSHLVILGAGRSPATGMDASHLEIEPDLAIGAALSSVISLAVQHPDIDADLVVLDFLADSERSDCKLAEHLRLCAHLGLPALHLDSAGSMEYINKLPETLAGRSAPTDALYVLALGTDRANLQQQDPISAVSPGDHLRSFMKIGPSVKAHLITTFATMAAFHAAQGYDAQGTIAGSLALGVDQSDLTSLLGPFVTYKASQNRGLFHRSGYGQPSTVVPFRPMTLRELSALEKVEWD